MALDNLWSKALNKARKSDKATGAQVLGTSIRNSELKDNGLKPFKVSTPKVDPVADAPETDASLLDRVKNTFSGGSKGSLAGGVNAFGSMFQFGQNARDRANQDLLSDYKQNLDRALRDLEAMRAANREKADSFSENEIQSQLYVIEDWQRKYDALNTVVGGDVQKKATDATYDLADQIKQSGDADIAKAKSGANKLGQFLVDTGAAGTQLAGDIAVGVVTGVGATVPIFIRGFGSGAQQARQNGATYERQVAYGLATATVEALTEKIASVGKINTKAFGSGHLDDILTGVVKAVEDCGKTAAGKAALNRVASIGTGALSEGLEELVSGLVDPIAQKIYSDEKIDWKQAAYDAGYQFLVGAALGGAMGFVGGTDTSKVDAKSNTTYNKSKDVPDASPAAAPEVQIVQTQAQATAAANPEAHVMDAAETLLKEIMPNAQPKTLAKKVETIRKLVAGEKVSDGEILGLQPDNPKARAVFSRLTGVQFPEGKVDKQKLLSLYRSAHTVATEAKKAVETQAHVEQAQTVTETQAQPAPATLDATPIGPDGQPLATQEEFAAAYRAANPAADDAEVDAQFRQYLQDGATVELRGQRMNLKQFSEFLRANAPGGNRLTDNEIIGLFYSGMEQEALKNKEATNGEQEYNPVYSAGLSGQPDLRSGGQGSGISEETGRVEGDGGARRGDQAGSRVPRVRENGTGETARAVQVNGAFRSIQISGQTLTEVLPEAYTPEMKGLAEQFAPLGANAHIVLEGYPIPGAERFADGIAVLNADSRDVYLQLSALYPLTTRADHELVHVAVFDDPELKKAVMGALFKAAPNEELLAVVGRYQALYATAYGDKSGAMDAILEEIIADAYAGLNRAGAGAPKYQSAIKPVVDEWLENKKAAYREPGTVFDDAGNPVVMSNDTGYSRFSMSTFKDSGREILSKWLKKAVKKKDLTQQDADDILTTIDLIYDICQNYKSEYAPFDAWSDAKVVVNADGTPVFSVVKANGDYAMNLDFSLVCKKRRTLDAVLNELVRRGFADNLALGQEEIVKINDIIREHGFETACDLCFVDAKRFRQADVADTFVKLYNELVLSLIPEHSGFEAQYFNFGGDTTVTGVAEALDQMPDSALDFTHINEVLSTYSEKTVEYKTAKLLKESAQDRKLTKRGDFLSTRGFDILNRENPRVLKLFNAKKGSGGPKSAVSDVQYLNEVLKSRTFNTEKAYAVGGVRVQSFSDYVPRMVFDYVQMIADLSAKKLPAHAYTKEELFVKQFGLTGMKINMSLIPKVMDNGIAPGLDADGNYAWADESFDFDEAIRVQNAEGYSRNCGTIAVGVSDEHIRALLADPEIRMVIPYHKSGLNPVVAKMNNIGAFTNYENSQNTRHLNGVKLDEKKDKKLLDAHPDFNTRMRELGDPRAAAEEYVRWCEDNNLLPKFDQFAYKQIDGMYVEKDGKRVVDENYYKLLEDFAVYDNGEYVEQTGLAMTFPDETNAFGAMKDLILRGLEEDAVLEGKRTEKIPEIVGEIMKFSVAGENAQNADMSQHAKAIQMLTSGATMEEIRQATGWWYSTLDNGWRFEIDDSAAVVKRTYGVAPLTDFLDHPELFDQYPFLKGYQVRVDIPAGSDLGGQLGYSSIRLQRNMSGTEFRRVLLHEVQHAVQRYEQREFGSNFNTAYWALFAETYDRIKDTPEFLRKRTYAGRVRAVERAILDAAIAAEPDLPQKLSVEKDQMFHAVWLVYASAVGEQEARDTEARLNMTAAEREQNPPYMADTGLTTRDAQQKHNTFRDVHKALGHNGVDNLAAPLYNQVRRELYGRGAGGVSEIAPRGDGTPVEQRDLRSAGGTSPNRRDARSYREETAHDQVTEQSIVEASEESGAFNLPETKYSISDESDSTGKQLTKEQQEYFKDSKVRDDNGKLIRLYHGTEHFGFTVVDTSKSDDGISFFMSDSPAMAESYSGTRTTRSVVNPDTYAGGVDPYTAPLSEVAEEFSYLTDEKVTALDTPDKLRDWAKRKLEWSDREIEKTVRDFGDMLPRWAEELEDTVWGENTEMRVAFEALTQTLDAFQRAALAVTPDEMDAAADALEKAQALSYDIDKKNIYYWMFFPMLRPVSVAQDLKQAATALRAAQNGEVMAARGNSYVFSEQSAREALEREYQYAAEEGVGNYELYANLTHPLIIDADDGYWDSIRVPKEMRDSFAEYFQGAHRITGTTRNFAEYAKAKGYDGVIFKNLTDYGPNAYEDDPATVVIAFDSNQVKAADNLKPTSDPDIRYSVAETDLSFAQQVDLVLQNKLNEVLAPGDNSVEGYQTSAVYVAKEPNPLMQELGYGDYPLIVTQRHIRQMTGKREDETGKVVDWHNHQLTPRQVKILPKLLEQPAAVLRAKGRPDSLVFVTTEKDYKGRPIIVPVKANGTDVVFNGVAGPAHVVATMYGHDNIIKLWNNAVDADEVVYYKKERIDPILESVAALSKTGTTPGIDPQAEIRVAEIDPLQVSPDTIVGAVEPKVKNVGERKYSITDEFEQWYKAGFQTEDDQKRVAAEIDRLRKLYGDIPAGENPVREANMPRKNTQEKRVHDTVRTVVEAEATPEKRLGDIQSAVVDGKMADVPLENTVAARRAHARIKRAGWDKALSDWHKAVTSGSASPDLVAEGAILLNNAGNSDMSGEAYVDLLTAYSELLHRVGQSLQAARILKRLSPEGQLYGIQGTVRKLNNEREAQASKKRGFDPEKWAEENEIKIDPALVKAFRDAKTDAERDAVITQIQQNIADQIPASLPEKLNTWRYLAMLGNFKTQIRNVLGNAFFQIPREIKETMAGGIEAALSHFGVPIERTRSVASDRESFAAAWADFESVRDIILMGGKVDEKMSYLNAIDSKRRIYKNAILEGYRKVVNTAMDEGDAVFCRFTYADSLARFMAANGTTWEQASEVLRERGRRVAIKEASEATYRDMNNFTETVLKMTRPFKNPQNGFEKGVNAVIEGVLPFKKTPANILARGVEYSPLGVIKTAVTAAKARRGDTDVTGADIVNELAKNLTGTGLFVLGYFMLKNGLLSALGPGDDDKEKKFWELQGNQSYSFIWNGKSYTVDWLAPEAIPLLAGANTAEISAEEGLNLTTVATALSRITDPMLELSMLQGVNDLIENIANTKTIAALPALVANSVWSYGLQYVPTLSGQAERAVDNTRRTTYKDAESGTPGGVQYALGKASAKIPGWDYNQIPYVDQWGRMEQNYESEVGNFFAQFLSPSYKSVENTSAMESELQRLFDQTGEASVLPGDAPKYFTVDGERRDLTAGEYVTYATYRGQTAYEMLTELTESGAYAALDDDGKVKAVERVYTYANDVAKAMALGTELPKSAEKVQGAGVDEAEYMALRAATGGITGLKDERTGETIDNSKGLQIMEYVYATVPGLSRAEYEALFEALGVGKTIRKYNAKMVENKLKPMRRKAGVE